MVKIGEDIQVKVVEKDFYCRKCGSMTSRCKIQHRSGWFARFMVFYEKAGAGFEFIAGVGEAEKIPLGIELDVPTWTGMSGCADFGAVYMTGGGWYRFKKPLFVRQIREAHFEEAQSLPLTTIEKDCVYQILNKYKVDIAVWLVRYGYLEPITGDMGFLSDVRPLVLTYRRDKIHRLPLGMELEEIKDSFTTKASFGGIKFHIVKGKVNMDLPYTFTGEFNVSVGGKEISYSLHNERRVVYLLDKNRVSSWIQYGDDVCYLRNIGNLHRVQELHNRLGNIVFIPMAFANMYEMLPNAAYSDLETDDIELLKGTIEEKDGALIISSPTVLYSSSWGVLAPSDIYEQYVIKKLEEW
ncbi:hypothetical protein [Thermovirga lienii]|jgi:hypothetical protein|uniref:hypothetical protein n=1 Tax=Thermovirga lienii TaxID=336261 RepID=UPI002FE00554